MLLLPLIVLIPQFAVQVIEYPRWLSLVIYIYCLLQHTIYYDLYNISVERILLSLKGVYVTVRLIQVLRKANQNAAQISSNMGHRSKRTLFTAVVSLKL